MEKHITHKHGNSPTREPRSNRQQRYKPSLSAKDSKTTRIHKKAATSFKTPAK